MLCYKDMTFCPFWEECYKEDCFRALTASEREKSEEIDIPICQYSEKPECFREKNV